jgi:hypothetical protein
MINFKFAILESFFTKKQLGNAYAKKDQDYPCCNSTFENSNSNKNEINKNCNNKSKCKNQQLVSSERNEKAKSTKGYITNNHLLLGFLPALYLISSIAIILILLSFRAFNNGNQANFLSLSQTPKANPIYTKSDYYDPKAKQNFNVKINTDVKNKSNNINNINNKNNNNKKNNNNNNNIKLHKINLTSTTTLEIPNFYDLKKINPTAYNIYVTLSCGSSLAISMILYSVLKQRFKVPEFQSHSFKLNIMLLFSLASNAFHLACAAAPPLINSFFRLGEEVQLELENETKQFLFLLHIFFSILFALYLLTVLNLVRNKNFDESKNSLFSKLQTEVQENKWFLYKYITLFYLCVFTLVYVLVLLQNAQIVSFGPFDVFIKEYCQLVSAIFPYFIQVINAVLVFTFYFELKFVNLALAQNLDVDYLFEEEDKVDL